MERDNPQRYAVEGRGEWGTLSGLIYSNWHIEEFDHKTISGIYCYGGDFGYVNSYTALIQIKVDTVNKKLKTNQNSLVIGGKCYEPSEEDKIEEVIIQEHPPISKDALPISHLCIKKWDGKE